MVHRVKIRKFLRTEVSSFVEQYIYDSFLDILREELVPAMGCTEPIAVAYAAALARDTLGRMPDRTDLIVSGNIVKNVKSVVVPNTGGRKGLRTAVAAGLCFGKAEKELEVIADATEEAGAFYRAAGFRPLEDLGCRAFAVFR